MNISLRLPWKKREPDKQTKKRIVAPEELASCIERILLERKTQCQFNNVPYAGLTLDEISKAVCLRLGNDWTVAKLERAGLKL